MQNTFLNLPEGFVVTVPNSKSFLMTYAYDAQTSQFDNNGQDVALKVLNTTYYVDPGSLGSDNNNGTSTSSPFATIVAYQQAGADQQDGAGDTIILRGRAYRLLGTSSTETAALTWNNCGQCRTRLRLQLTRAKRPFSISRIKSHGHMLTRTTAVGRRHWNLRLAAIPSL